MRILITRDTVLKGIGFVKQGDEFSDENVARKELIAVVAWGKAIDITDSKPEPRKPTPDDIKNQIAKNAEKVPVNKASKTGGLTSDNTAALKG